MPHDASKVQLGTTRSSVREVSNHAGSESTFEAGLVVHLKSDDTISLAASDGQKLGVSLGKSLSDVGRVAICRKGLGVPILLTDAFTPTVGAQVAVSDTTGKAIGYTGSGNAYVSAVYKTAVITGVKEDGTTANVAIIDFPGGL